MLEATVTLIQAYGVKIIKNEKGLTLPLEEVEKGNIIWEGNRYYKVLDFRFPTVGDQFLSSDTLTLLPCGEGTTPSGPRLIVKRVKKVRRRADIYWYNQLSPVPRYLEVGEWTLVNNNSFIRCNYDKQFHGIPFSQYYEQRENDVWEEIND